MRPGAKLLLFDIDGTLLSTGGAGTGAMLSAFSDQFASVLTGRPLPVVNFSGSTDLGILRELAGHFDFEPAPEIVAEFFAEYLIRLERNLATHDPDGNGRLPGVLELLTALALPGSGHRVNLLTGNIQAGAWLKVRHYGLAGFFSTGAFGDDHHDRNELCAVAVQRELAWSGRRFDPEDIVVIGDTPRDIACGKAHGAHTLAVATGSYRADELAAHGPTAVLDSFADSNQVLEFLARI